MYDTIIINLLDCIRKKKKNIILLFYDDDEQKSTQNFPLQIRCSVTYGETNGTIAQENVSSQWKNVFNSPSSSSTQARLHTYAD
jgi:hypothetical protein